MNKSLESYNFINYKDMSKSTKSEVRQIKSSKEINKSLIDILDI